MLRFSPRQQAIFSLWLSAMQGRSTITDITVGRRRAFAIAEGFAETATNDDFVELNGEILQETTTPFLDRLTKRFNGSLQETNIINQPEALQYEWILSMPTALISYAQYCDRQGITWDGAAGYCRYAYSQITEYLTLVSSLSNDAAKHVNHYMILGLIQADFMPSFKYMQEELRPWVTDNWPQPHV